MHQIVAINKVVSYRLHTDYHLTKQLIEFVDWKTVKDLLVASFELSSTMRD